jgi:RNA polymerase sigma factor (sigma-70 family)
MVFNLSLSYIQNIEEAEEITQDVFVAIYQSMEKFQEKSSITTWIYRITINKSLDYIKAKNRKKRLGVFASLFYENTQVIKHDRPSFNHPGVLLEQKESVELIFNHINQLPDNQKTALILYKLERKSLQEIAVIMDISTKAVESMIQRAKANLAKKINNIEGNE